VSNKGNDRPDREPAKAAAPRRSRFFSIRHRPLRDLEVGLKAANVTGGSTTGTQSPTLDSKVSAHAVPWT